MKQEMQQLEQLAKKADDNQLELKEKEKQLIRDAKQQAHKAVQKMNQTVDSEEKIWQAQMEEEINAYRTSIAEQVEKEIAFYQRYYDENKDFARKQLIKEIFGYGNRKNE